MVEKKWHVFYDFGNNITTLGVLLPVSAVDRGSLYHAEFDTEEEARAFVAQPTSSPLTLSSFRLQFVIHGERINPTVKTVEKIHRTFDQEVVWERE